MHGVWNLFVEAIRGAPRDYTTGHVGQAIVLLAIPTVIEMGMESLFAVVDVYFVSRLGSDAVATVGLTESLLVIVYTVAAGLGIVIAVAVRTFDDDTEFVLSAAEVQAIEDQRRQVLAAAPTHVHTPVRDAALAQGVP